MADFWAIVPGSLLLFLPGYALSRIIPREDMEPFQRAIVSIGLSLALMPLVLLWTTQAGLSWGGPTAWGLALLSGLVSFWTPKGGRSGKIAGGKDASNAQPGSAPQLPDAAQVPDTTQSPVAAQPPGPAQAPDTTQSPVAAQPPGPAQAPDTTQLPGAAQPPGPAQAGDTAQLIVRYHPPTGRYGAPLREGFFVWYRRPRQLQWLRTNAPFVLLAAVFVASLAVRLLAIRDVSLPLWGDSLHHSWLARLIVERGQVPDSFFPYFPLDSLTYHFGYHSMVAFFSWTAGLPVAKSVLIFGQLLNAIGVLTVYLLAHRLTRSHTAALLSGLVVGLVSLMPAYYVNWGRYTQLAGQVVLPVALFLVLEAVERRHWGYLALAAAAAAGLFLTHYRVILFYVAFLVAYTAWRALESARRDAPARRLIPASENNPADVQSQASVDGPALGAGTTRGDAPPGRLYNRQSDVAPAAMAPEALGRMPPLGKNTTGRDAPMGRLYAAGDPASGEAQAPGHSPERGNRATGEDAPRGRLHLLGDVAWLAGVGMAALALASPRLWYLALNLPRGEASVPQLSPEAWDQWMTSYNALGDVAFFLSWPLLALTLGGFLWAIFKKESIGPVIGGWVALLLLMANAERLGLGRGAWLNNFAVLIALYLPASVLLGWLGAQFLQVSRRAWRAAPYALAGLAAVAALWSGWGMVGIVDSRHILVTPTDERAMAWIRDNTPENARFLVNYFFAYGGKYVVGSDGGWWLPFLTGREANVPPILYGAESSPEKDYAARVNALARSLQGDVYTKDGQLLMQEEGISHIFIGEKGGFLDPNKLLAAGHQAVYRDGPVWIFKVSY